MVTEGLRSYQSTTTKEFYSKASTNRSVRIPNLRDKSNNNAVERLHGSIRQRNKSMQSLDDEATAQTMIEGLQIHYNFLRSQMALDGKTPTQQTKISGSESANWLSILKRI